MTEVYEYVFDILFSVPSKEIEFKPYSIVEFVKECNYFDKFIPTYKLTCKIRDKHLNYLRIFDKEINVNIRHHMFYGESRSNLNKCKILSELDFACYFDKNSLPSYMNVAKESSVELDGTDSYISGAMGRDMPHVITFYLLLKTDLKMKTFIHNYIFGSEEKPASTIDAAMAIVELNPYVKEVLIDPPDNTSVYTDIIVEPAELKDAIKNLQYKYGIYSKGLELFFDNGMLYILNKMNLTHCKKKDELNLIQIRVNENRTAGNPIDYCLVNEKDGYIGYERLAPITKEDYESIEGIYTGDKFVYSNYGSVINAMFGNKGDTTFVSPLNEVERPRSARVDVGVKKILDYDMLNNPFNMSSYVFERSQGVPLTIPIQSMNPEHFSPNKIIKLGFDTTESQKLYSGLYNIRSVSFIYRQTDGNPMKTMNAYGHAIITVMNKQEGYDKDYEPEKK